jgi:type I restriction enzyme S subunit
MKSNYKPLGKYIRLVDERNTELLDLPLMGLSVSKVFFPTIANLVGTDMSTYKIVYKNQFTYIADTSRRGDKIAIALNEKFEKMLVSQAYTPFEVSNTSELDPEYLMMWFRRPEFDRYARFKSHGSAREIFDWEEMCNTLLPVPSITKQREIVKEYNVVQNRITLNQQLIQKLEETAQAIYKQWLVKGQEENIKTILKQYIITNPQLSIKKNTISTYVEMNDLTTTSMRIAGSIKREFIGGSKFQNNDTLLARITPCLENGKTAFVDILEKGEIAAGSTEFIVMRSKENISPYWVYCLARDENFRSYAISSMVGSSGRERVHEKYLENFVLPEINPDNMNDFHSNAEPIFKMVNVKSNEIVNLTTLQDLLLSKLATIEN